MNSKLLSSRVCDVHLWKYCLQNPVSEVSLALLSAEEKEVMRRMSRYEDRKQYMLVHSFLKRVLESYLHLPPDEIEFAEGVNGKPILKCNHSHPPLHFSLSYRHDYALLAISSEPCIGVDVEEVKPIENIFHFMTDHFSRDERKRILIEKTEKRQLSILFTFWAMKEALIKSLSVGFSGSIKKYEVLSFLKKPLGLPDFDLANNWWIDTVPIAKNYKAAFALKAGKVNTKIFEYNF